MRLQNAFDNTYGVQSLRLTERIVRHNSSWHKHNYSP
jgi:hypothetical protein